MQHFGRLAFRRFAVRQFATRGLASLSSTAPAVVALALTLGGCQTDDLVTARALRPLPPELAAEIDKRNMPRESPILIRLFKEESELEVWKQDVQGKYALLKTYAICRWSGELGPKVKQGDRQAPEGFYAITPGQMNPNSNYYLAFNLGFPNAYDKANDRNGDFLMVHGDCSSAGCYAMTDEQIQEIYILGRDAFLGGQKAFQVQAYPFRMTALNMARHRDNPNMPFWRMLKEGNDHFEVSRAEPHVEVCDKHYVFDPRTPASASTPVVFHPREQCPVYDIAPEIASAVKAKEASDDRAMAEYVRRGVATVAVRTGADGGMHPVFLSKLPGQSVFEPQGVSWSADVKAPSGPLPAYVSPPRAPEQPPSLLSFAAPSWGTSPADSAAPAATTSSSGSTIGAIGHWLGLGGEETAAPPPVATTAAASPPPKTRTARTATKPKSSDAKSTETAQVPSTPSPSVR